MKTLLVSLCVALCVALFTFLLVGCGDGTTTAPAVQPTLIATYTTSGTPLTTTVIDGKVWFIGRVDRSITFTLPMDRGGLNPGETGLRVEVAGTGIVVPADYDISFDLKSVSIHRIGMYQVKMLVGLADGAITPVGKCWLKIE